MGGVEAENVGGESSDENEGMVMEGANHGEPGTPGHLITQTSDPMAITGTTTADGPPQGTTDSAIIANEKLPECISGEKSEFQHALQEINSELSKFDSPEMGQSTIGPKMVLDQTKSSLILKNPSSTGLQPDGVVENDTHGSPLELNCNTRGWKRLVQDGAPVETQSMQTQKKRNVREGEDVFGGKTPGKKLRASTVEAVSQPRRSQ